MIFDIETIIAIGLAVLQGIIIFYVYNKHSTDVIDKTYQIIETLYEKYKEKIAQDNPKLAEECELALQAMKQAMEDGQISAMEALKIAETFVPLMNRLVKFIKEKYTN